MPNYYRRLRQRLSQRTALNSPASRPDLPDDVPPPPTTRGDWPEIQSRHPGWWQVHRVELDGDERRYVLIAEMRTEMDAFDVAAKQISQVRITKWGSRQPAHFSYHPPRRRQPEDRDEGGLRLHDGSTGE
jgi:hypothetical protein